MPAINDLHLESLLEIGPQMPTDKLYAWLVAGRPEKFATGNFGK